MKTVLERGPWFIAGRFLVLKRWERNLNLSVEVTVSKLPVWALLYNVPVELWTPKGLSYLSSALGKPLFADTATLSRKRLNYARVCIEIDAGASLIEEFDLASGNTEDPGQDPIKITVVYQWKPAKCSHCLVFGHSLANCEVNPVAKANPKGKEQVPEAFATTQTQVWSRVRRRSRNLERPGQSRDGSIYNRAPNEDPQTSLRISNSFHTLDLINEDIESSDVDKVNEPDIPMAKEGSTLMNDEIQGQGQSSNGRGGVKHQISNPGKVRVDTVGGFSLEQTKNPATEEAWSDVLLRGTDQRVNSESATLLPLQIPNLSSTLAPCPPRSSPAVGLMLATDLPLTSTRSIQNKEKEVLYPNTDEPIPCLSPTSQNLIDEQLRSGNTPGQSEKDREWTRVSRKWKNKGRGSQSPKEIYTEQMMKEGSNTSSKNPNSDDVEYMSPSPDLMTGLARRVRFIDGLANLPSQLERVRNSEVGQPRHRLKNPVSNEMIQMGSNVPSSPLSTGLNAGPQSSSPC